MSLNAIHKNEILVKIFELFFQDIEGSIDYNQNVMIGSDFRIKFHLKNKGNHARKIKTATIFVFSESYTGCILEEAFFKKGLDKEFELKPKQGNLT